METTIYLNYAELRGQKLLRLLFKPDDKIIQTIKQNDWIYYHPTLLSYCTPATREYLAIIIDLFKGIATVSLKYMNASPKVNASQISIDKEIKFDKALPVQKKSGSMLLLPVEENNQRRILIKYKYMPGLAHALSRSVYLDYDTHFKAYSVPAKRSVFIRFVSDFSKQYTIKLHHKLEIRDIEIRKILMEQNYCHHTNFKTCPASYLQYMVQNNYSWNTIGTYHSYLLRFINSYKSNSLEQVNNFDNSVINDYHYQMQQAGLLSVSAINQSVNAIKLYYKSVLKKDIKTASIIRPRTGISVPPVYSADEMQKIIQAAASYIKHKAIIMVLYSSGVRVGELVNLKPSDIVSDRKLMLIRGGKGKKDRYTILSTKTLETLREYYKECKPKEYLFEGQFGGKYSPSSVRNMIEQKVNKAGVTKRGSAHTFRHTFATHLLEAGVDIRIIQALLGHESSRSTEIYTHISKKHLSKIKNPLDSLDI